MAILARPRTPPGGSGRRQKPLTIAGRRTYPFRGTRYGPIPSYSQSVWELDRALEDDTRAASLFAWLAGAGMFTWLASIVLADSLLPITTITALGALVFGLIGWRATKHGDPREATNFVALSLAIVLAVLWLFLLGSLLLRLF
jgi:hypothetical protein